MRSLNIAYFLSVTADYVGGADHTLFMQAVLMKSWHNVTVVLPCGKDGQINEKFRKKCEAHGLEYEFFAYDATYTLQSINMVDYKRDIDRIECFVKEKRISILHSVQINPIIEYVSRKYRIPHVMNIYSTENWEWKVPYPDIFPQYISCDSEFYLKKWMAYTGGKGKCIRVYDEMRVKRQILKDKCPVVIGAAGTVCEYKNYIEVIKAAELVIKRGRNVRLLIAGDDSLSYAICCRDYINSHQLQEYIRLSGFVDNMGEFFEKIDAFICGSRRESFPASIVEAVSCNIPVISTPVAGVPEVLKDGENSYLSHGYCAEDLAEAMERFLDDYGTAELSRILAGEKKIYEAYFTAQAVKWQLDGLYGDMLDNMAEIRKLQNMEIYEDKVRQLIRKMETEGLEQEDMKLAYSRLLYLCQIKDHIAGRQCYIWGAGRWGRITRVLLKCLTENTKIIAFVDENKGNSVEGIPVIKKEKMELCANTAVLVSFVSGQEEAVAYLQEKGMEIMENIFLIA